MFFETYSSNTCAGSGNQLIFTMAPGEVRTGRVLYKITHGGRYHYSILFSNIMDSTYNDGAVSHCNQICDSWKIHRARIGHCCGMDSSRDVTQMTMADGEGADITVGEFVELTFQGKPEITAQLGGFFSSDPVELEFCGGEYLCLELTFSGRAIPYHEESLLPVFVKTEAGWRYCREMPFAGMIGCDRRVAARIAYLGDSITQGIGTPLNSYAHWNVLLSQKLGPENGYWNLGIGYARAQDAASDGAWLYKAKKNDVVFVCCGANDVMQGIPPEQIQASLLQIVDELKKSGCKVILQTIPPYEYQEQEIPVWEKVNTYIRKELAEKVDLLFDNGPVLCLDEAHPSMPKYGGHPNAQGCAVWAEALYQACKEIL